MKRQNLFKYINKYYSRTNDTTIIFGKFNDKRIAIKYANDRGLKLNNTKYDRMETINTKTGKTVYEIDTCKPYYVY